MTTTTGNVREQKLRAMQQGMHISREQAIEILDRMAARPARTAEEWAKATRTAGVAR